MKVTGQKNVYYIDINKSIYKGYIETSLNVGSEKTIYYKYASLEILSVDITLENGNSFEPDMEKFSARENLNHLDPNIWKMDMSNVLEISLPELDTKDITIKIEYSPLENNTSICYYKQVYEDDKHKEIVGTNRHGYSFELFPSIWTSNDRIGYPWELIYILPNIEEYKIVSPGLLKSFKEEESVNISMYFVEESIPNFINFAVGTYERVEIYNGDDKKVLLVPCYLEEYNEAINEVVEDFANILRYAEHFLQKSFPIPALSILFSMVELDLTLGIGTSLGNISLISPFKDIEQAFKMKRVVASIISSQIFYFYIHYLDITDFWIFCGMKGYFEDYCVRFILGNNDYLFNFKEERDFVFKNDVYELPLCDSRRDYLSYQSEFFEKKSKLIFHTLENNLSKAFLGKICNYTLKKTNQEIGHNFTHDFIALIKDITGKDMKSFFDSYVFRPGLVKILFRFTIDRKKNRVDFRVEQSSTSKLPSSNQKINGFITVKSYEVEGSYDHSFNFNQENYFYYHTRTKKKKKPDEEEEEIMPLLWIRIDPKREHLLDSIVEQPDYMFIEQLLDKNVIGQVEAIDYLSKRPSVQICEAFERILENTQMFYKVRIRILYVLARINIENYTGFQRVIQFFIKKFCVQSSTVIKPNDFNYTNYFLQKHSIKALSFTDPHIVKNYNGRPVSSASIICAFMMNILRFNDNSMNTFSDSYYISSVIRSLVCPILAINSSGNNEMMDFKAKTDYKDIFLEREEDHKKEEFDENDTLGIKETEDRNELDFLEEDSSSSFENKEELPSENSNYIEMAIREVERYRLLDMFFPSHNNIVTESTLYFLGRLAFNSCVGISKGALLYLCSYPNAYSVRKTALNLLVILFPDKDTVEFIFNLLHNEVYRIKLLVVETLEEIISKNICDLKEHLKEINKIASLFPYDFILRHKFETIQMFIEGRDLSLEEYNTKLLDFYNEKFDKDFYFKKTMTQFIPQSTESIKIRVLNFVELQKENLLKTNRLKIFLNRKGFCKVNTYGPPHKRPVKKAEIKDICKPETKKPIEAKIEEKKPTEKVLENKPEEKEDVVQEKSHSIEEANIQEMLMNDHCTEELLTSSVKPKAVSSPFIESKNKPNKILPPNNEEDKVASPNLKAKEKKEYLEGLFSFMKKTIDKRIENCNKPGINPPLIHADPPQHSVNFHKSVEETFLRPKSGMLERLLMEDDEVQARDPNEVKTLEILLDDDYVPEPAPLKFQDTNLSRTYPAIDIDSFLDGNFEVPLPEKKHNLVKLSGSILRLKIGWSIRLKAVSPPPVFRLSSSFGEFSTRKKSRPKYDTFMRDHFFEGRRVTRAQRIYEETIQDAQLKPLNHLIAKNRDKHFFSWVPKTFSEIEEMILEGIGHSSVSKELERTLVFILTFSQVNNKIYLMAKKMFDNFDEIRFTYTPIPLEVTEMTPSLREACVDFLKTIYLEESFIPFIKPVDTDAHRNYLDLVRFPMCLEIIQKKMNVYQSLECFFGDLRQILKNCCYFNQNNADICNHARRLLRYVNDFNRRIQKYKVMHRSIDVLKALLARMSNVNLYSDIIYKLENVLYKTFYELYYDIDKVRENYIRIVVAPQQLTNDIDDFKAQVYYWFNILEGKNICFGL